LSLLTQEPTEGLAEIFEISGKLIEGADRQNTPKVPESHSEVLRSKLEGSKFPSPRNYLHPDSYVQSIPSILPRTMQDFVLESREKSAANARKLN